jgi:hypothetical protein
MATNFKQLLEGSGLADEAKETLQEAWEQQISEAKEQVTAELREEFSKKFQHDKRVLIESMDNFLRDKIQAEIEDFAKDKQSLVAERVKYKSQVKEHIAKLDQFVVENLANEVSELRKDKVKMKENVNQLETFLIKKLSEEIQEFHKDKQSLVEQRVKLVSEGKKQITEAKQSFVKKAALVVESTINDVLRKEIAQCKQDITAARENDFGRRIFESYVGEYMTSFLNEGSELAKMKSLLLAKEAELTESKKLADEKDQLVESVNRKLSVAQDRLVRTSTMNKLLAPLGKDKRQVMVEMLKTVETSKLNEAYDKYLPSVLNETIKQPMGKKVLAESVSVKTGNKPASVTRESSTLAVEIQQLKNWAGIN